MGRRDATDLGDEVELEKVCMQLDDLPIARGQRFYVQRMGWRGVEMEVE